MIGAICRSVATAVTVAVALAVPLAFAAAPNAVETGGLGRLTICRSWLLFTSCQSYNHITIPERIAVGDTIELIFGSNTKKIRYPIAAIAKNGGSCTLYNVRPPDGSREVDHIVAACRPVTP